CNADKILKDYDLIIDGLADWQDKLVIGDECMRLSKPLVHVAIAGFNFHLYAMLPGKSACLRCLFTQVGIEDFPTTKVHNVSFSPIEGMAGTLQASEAIKIIAHVGITPADEYIHFDGLRREFHTERGFRPTPDCPDCGRYAARS
ncbi:MAG: ThiF family adenylyltransferase, partial [Candidatus Melainabacteria bacterium]|nr:ThiF family adenylyltransferase [Candidatus Melainabacteria bacterium]